MYMTLISHRFAPIIVTLTSIWLTAWISWAPLNDLTQKDVSDIYQNILTPAGFTFSIWSIIYSSWIFWSIAPLIPTLKNLTSDGWFAKIGALAQSSVHPYKAIAKSQKVQFMLAMILSVIWLMFWHHLAIGLSVFCMIVLFAILFHLYQQKQDLNPILRISVELTFSWIAIALIANIAAYTVSLGWIVNPIDNERLAWILGFPAILVVITLHSFYRSYIGMTVTIWSLIGLISAQSGFPIVQFVSLGLMIGTIVILSVLHCQKITRL